MVTRGIRGAITVNADIPDEILSATRELLSAVLTANPDFHIQDIASVIFTVTEDIRSAFPAQAARQMGWDNVPMICAREIPVPDSLPLVIRVLIHWNIDFEQNAIHHVYLREAVKLRPDLIAAR
jgi:chorismate mutase